MTITETNPADSKVLAGGFPNVQRTQALLVEIGEDVGRTMADAMLRRTLAIGDYLVNAGITNAATRGRGKALDALLSGLPETAGLSKSNVQRFARYYLEAKDRGLTLTAPTVKALNAAIEAGSEAYTATITSPGLSDDNVVDRADAAIEAAKAKKAAQPAAVPQTLDAFVASIVESIRKRDESPATIVKAIEKALK
jgi:hypothetical protein